MSNDQYFLPEYTMRKMRLDGTHIQLVNAHDIKEYDIIQIYPVKVYDNGPGVWLAEVMDKKRADAEGTKRCD